MVGKHRRPMIKFGRPPSEAKNTFGPAKGRPDGVTTSRWRNHGDAPFGQPFSYTDATDLPGDFAHPGESGRYTKGAVKLPWYKRLFRRKPPVGWAVVDPEYGRAEMLHGDEGEVKTSSFNPGFLMPIHDDRAIIAADAYEREATDEEGR